MVNGPDDVYVERKGRLEKVTVVCLRGRMPPFTRWDRP
jgi:hypothetical protein